MPRKNQTNVDSPVLNQSPSHVNSYNAVESASETTIRPNGLCTCNGYLRSRSPMNSLIPSITRNLYTDASNVRIDCERRKFLYSDEKSVLIRDENGKLQPRFVLI